MHESVKNLETRRPAKQVCYRKHVVEEYLAVGEQVAVVREGCVEPVWGLTEYRNANRR